MIFSAMKGVYIQYQTRKLTRLLLVHVDALGNELHSPAKNPVEYEGHLLECLHVYRRIMNLNKDPKISALIHKVGYDVRRSYARHCGMEVVHC